MHVERKHTVTILRINHSAHTQRFLLDLHSRVLTVYGHILRTTTHEFVRSISLLPMVLQSVVMRASILPAGTTKKLAVSLVGPGTIGKALLSQIQQRDSYLKVCERACEVLSWPRRDRWHAWARNQPWQRNSRYCCSGSWEGFPIT